MSLQDTPRSNRLHIGIYGKRNAGKSTLMNLLLGHEFALVSEVAGTTTDPVYKSIEIIGVGPCVIIDTPGYDDEGYLGDMRVEQTKKAMEKTEIALILCCDSDLTQEKEWFDKFKERKTPVILLLSKSDTISDVSKLEQQIEETFQQPCIPISCKDGKGKAKIVEDLIRMLPEEYDKQDITGNLVHKSDVVLLVMPQDIQAPKGRLILPQVQTIRELLDKQAIVISVTLDQMDGALESLKDAPKLIITDSQVFTQVYERKPKESLLTSFSVLFAAYKGDVEYFLESVHVIGQLTEKSKVLIGEACTHTPVQEDIGRVKLPRMLKARLGENLQIVNVSGNNFPTDLRDYDLVIHCGACMFNRKYVLSRVHQAKRQGVPMTNYGIAMGYMTGILDKIVVPDDVV